jgi:secondary thiamine-phosphate synthase enzyme
MGDFRVKTKARAEFVDITDKVNHAVAAEGIAAGLCNLFVPHTTCAVIVSENWDPDVTTDMLAHLERVVPRDGGYRHGEGNSQAHILSVMLGTSINIPVVEAKLKLGKWQGVMLAEFDGPRERTVSVSVVAAERAGGR